MTAAEKTAHADLIFKALASEARREIITILATSSEAEVGRCCGGEVCACTFSEKLGLGAPTVSHHMRTLLDAGLVVAEKRGLWVYYRLAPQAMADITGAVASLSLGEQASSIPTCECG